MYLPTERLILREMRPDDQAALYAYSLEPATQQYDLPDPLSQWEFQQIAVWMADEQHVIPRTYYYLGVALRGAVDQLIGSVHLTITSHSQGEAEIGYLLGTAYHHQGYATEAARALLAFGFVELRLNRIDAADIIRENIASIRVAEKIGMHCREVRAAAQFFHGRWWDTLTYSISRAAWEEHHPG